MPPKSEKRRLRKRLLEPIKDLLRIRSRSPGPCDISRVVARIGDAFPELKTAATGIVAVFDRVDGVKDIQPGADALMEQVKSLETMFNPSHGGASPPAAKDRLDGLSRALEEQRKRLEKQFPVAHSHLPHTVLSTGNRKILMQVVQYIGFSIEVTVMEMVARKINISQQFNNALFAKLGHVVGSEFSHEDYQGCTPGTRVSLLADLLSWANADDSPHVFWLNGMAGTGKTTVSVTFSSLLQQKGLLGGSFFCSMKSKTPHHSVHAIFPSLARSMAETHPLFCQKLVDVLVKCPHPLGMDLKDQYTRLILRPSEAAFAKDEIVVLNIDALDECEDQEAIEKLLNIILDSMPTVPLRFFITSRPERQIRQAFELQHHQLLQLHDIEDHLIEADIALYLTHQLWRVTKLQSGFVNNWPPWEITVIVQRAGKLFIYAATISNYIKDRDDPYECLQRISALSSPTKLGVSGVEELYEFILTEALSGLKSEEASCIISCLSILISARQPLSTSTYAKILDMGVTQIQAAFGALHAVVGMPDGSAADQRITVYHASFPDYLSSHADIQAAHCQNVKHCFKILNEELHLGISGATTSHKSNKDQPQPCGVPPYLAYFCTAWGNLVLSANPSCTAIAEDFQAEIENFLRSKFLFWLEALSAINEVAYVPPLFNQLLQKVPGTHPLNLILSDFAKFTTSFLYPIQYSAPHIYLSALPFAPETSMVAKIYLPHFPSICSVQHSKIYTEHECLMLQFDGHTGGVYSVACSPNGQYIASGSKDQTIQIWSVETGQAVSKLLKGHTNTVCSVCFSPDGRHIASGSSDHTIRIWSVETGQTVSKPFRGHIGPVLSVSFSPDGKYIASGAEDKTVQIWNVETGQAILEPLKGHPGYVRSVSFSPDGKYVASGSFEGIIQIWSVKTGQAIPEPLKGHTGWIRSVSFSPDGRYIASGSSDKTIRIWSVETGQEVSEPLTGHADTLLSVSFSPDGRYIASGSSDKTVRIWSVETGQEVSEPLTGHTGIVHSVSFSPDGRHIVSGSSDSTIKMWSVEAGQTVSKPLKEYTAFINSVSFSPDGRYIASGSNDYTIQIWSVETGQAISEPLKGHTGYVRSVSFSPDGRHIASGAYDCTILIWNVETGQVSNSFKGHTGPVLSVKFSPDGRYIASGSDDHTVQMWSLATGHGLLNPMNGHADFVNSVSFSPDGRYIASGSADETVQIWNAETGQAVSEPLKGHTRNVCSVAFSPDGRHIASGSSDMTIQIWNVETGQALSNPFKGCTGGVLSVSFSPDGRYIASGSSDKTVRIWSVETGTEVSEPLKGHTDYVKSVSFSSDGRYIASGSNDYTVRIWRVETAQAVLDLLEWHENDHGTHLWSNMISQVPTENTAPQTIFLHEYPAGFIVVNENHWLQCSNNDLMLWVPPNLHFGLYLPGTIKILGTKSTKINLSHFVYGKEWQKCIYNGLWLQT